MAAIEVDDHTYRSLEFAARMAGTSAGEVVARLVAQASMPEPEASATGSAGASDLTAVFAIYGGRRTHGTYDPQTTRIDIISGPLAGRSFKTPSAAAKAVVAHYNPTVSTSRNGWKFWRLDDGTDQKLQAVQPS